VGQPSRGEGGERAGCRPGQQHHGGEQAACAESAIDDDGDDVGQARMPAPEASAPTVAPTKSACRNRPRSGIWRRLRCSTSTKAIISTIPPPDRSGVSGRLQRGHPCSDEGPSISPPSSVAATSRTSWCRPGRADAAARPGRGSYEHTSFTFVGSRFNGAGCGKGREAVQRHESRDHEDALVRIGAQVQPWRCTCAPEPPSPNSPGRSIRSSEVGCSTTGRSIAPH
jgi:hypothetical protein